MSSKKRLDRLLQEQMPQLTRNQIASFIAQGEVTVNGQVVTKAGAQIREDAVIVCAHEQPRYVSRGGLKLERALDHFTINVTGLVALDAGISTGGFTDCLLQHGAARVYGIDVGYGQVHEKVRRDPRVILRERTNVRYLDSLPELVDIVTLDLAFISVLKVMPALVLLMKPHAQLVVLIKPQFEAERHEVGKGGIVRDEQVHEKVVRTLCAGITAYGFTCVGVIESPILGASGNKEFLGYFVRNDQENPSR
jgi:23S rRNA (cytidine1920-2'-O)/16S rRNA (cytidine1409-2'-O)-methyltransferase